MNFASAQRIGGDLAKLPETLVYANFNAAQRFTGDINKITAVTPANALTCPLKELDLGSMGGTAITGGFLSQAGAAVGLMERCKDLKYVDLGGLYDGTHVKKGDYDFIDTVCLKANGLASKGCQ